MSYQTVSSIHNSLCRTIVTLEFEKTCIVVCLLESQYIVDIGSAKTVYALSVITNDTHHLSFFCNLVDNGLLGKVGVLILIYKNIFKSLGIFSPDIFVVCKQ